MGVKDIPLADTPDIFQQAVQTEINYFANCNVSVNVLAIKVYTATPYTDKTVVTTTYKAYIEIGTCMTVVRYEQCSKPEWNYEDTHVNRLTFGDIEIFLQYSRWFNPSYITAK